MKIIQKKPNPSGAYPPILQWSKSKPPESHYVIICDTTNFYKWNGFIIPTIKNGKVVSYTCNTALWEQWKPNPLEETREASLNRIDGKCSSAIYSGVTVGDKHYKLTPTAQGNLATAQAKVDGGAESIIYAADDEEPTLHTAEQITDISDAAYKWGIVNTSYYAKLQKWIARETDIDVLAAIDYGVKLPDDLMQELSELLAGVEINIGTMRD